MNNNQEQSAVKWQNEWTDCEKGGITKAFIPNIANKLKLNIGLTPNLTSILTGHGKTKAYLHRFKLINNNI